MNQDANDHDPNHHGHHHGHDEAAARSVPRNPQSLNALAFWATLHCLSGCAIGEVLGMVLATAFGLSNASSIALATALAFLFGYAFTALPLLRSGMPLRSAAALALASDTISIGIMEVADNAVMLVWPGAMDAALTDLLFWVALAVSLAIAAIAAYPANRWLISRGRGHAVVHAHHAH